MNPPGGRLLDVHVPDIPGMTRSETRELAAIVTRIVGQVDPIRIILFGSRARGQARPQSDADLLVLVPRNERIREQWAYLLDATASSSFEVDLVLTTPEEYAWRSQVPGFVQHDAAHHGWILYERG